MTHRRSLGVALGSLLLLAASACGSDDDGGGSGGSGVGATTGATTPGGDAEPAALAGMTEAHNAARRAVDPPAATPIPPLAWSGEVAAAAQAHADRCEFQHSGSSYGENIYATSGTATPAEVVDDWVAEASNYDHDSNTCNGTCGHYTQVVWAASRRLGCGVATCTKGSPFQSADAWQFWVCNYDPPGNYIGQSPY